MFYAAHGSRSAAFANSNIGMTLPLLSAGLAALVSRNVSHIMIKKLECISSQ
jgi:hypothetical protein